VADERRGTARKVVEKKPEKDKLQVLRKGKRQSVGYIWGNYPEAAVESVKKGGRSGIVCE
jgi:hypothetical protein